MRGICNLIKFYTSTSKAMRLIEDNDYVIAQCTLGTSRHGLIINQSKSPHFVRGSLIWLPTMQIGILHLEKDKVRRCEGIILKSELIFK